MAERPLQQPSIVIIAVIAVLWAAWAANAFLTPLSLAVFILALTWPVQARLERGLPKVLALFLTLAVVLAVTGLLGFLTLWAFGTLWQSVSNNAALYQKSYQSAADWFEGHGIVLAGLWADNFSVTWMLRMTQQILARMSQTMSFWVVTIAYLLTALVEAGAVRRSVESMQNQVLADRIVGGISETAWKLRRYMWVRTVISLVSGIAVAAFAFLANVPYALEWGMIAFTLNFIPFLGPLVATCLPSLFILVQLEDPARAFVVFCSLTLIQFLTGSYIEPRISGSALRLSPFVILMAIFLWSFLWGIYGTFIGVPIAIALSSFAARSRSTDWLSRLMRGRPVEPSDNIETIMSHRGDPHV